MSLLAKADSGLACYCKGNMYEFGGGVSIDLDQAIKNYNQSIRKGGCRRAEKRLAACQWKKERESYERSSDNYYQSNKSYYSTSTQTSSTTVDDGCFTPETRILMADGTYCAAENIKTGDRVVVFDHYKGRLGKEKIIANVHAGSEIKGFHVIGMIFKDGTKLEIVKSHVLFDRTDNQYVWINSKNIKNYIGHSFACFENGNVQWNRLVHYSVEWRETNYYMPISRFHMNIFAENILTMPPTKLTANLFHVGKDMQYDLEVLEKIGITSYDEISGLVSAEEYENLPCKYLSAVLSVNNCTMEDFEYALALYREQEKYLNKM